MADPNSGLDRELAAHTHHHPVHIELKQFPECAVQLLFFRYRLNWCSTREIFVFREWQGQHCLLFEASGTRGLSEWPEYKAVYLPFWGFLDLRNLATVIFARILDLPIRLDDLVLCLPKWTHPPLRGMIQRDKHHLGCGIPENVVYTE